MGRFVSATFAFAVLRSRSIFTPNIRRCLAMSAASNPSGPITIVTGANKGIGFEVLRKIAPASKVAVLAARSEPLAMEAIQKLKREEGLENIVFHHLDLNNPPSIGAFVDGIKDAYGKCDILVNNAGFAYKGADPTPFEKQTEPTLTVNFFNTCELTQRIAYLLRVSDNPRIVNVASQSGRLAILDSDRSKKQEFSDPNLRLERLHRLMRQFKTDVEQGIHKENGWPSSCYGMSKLGLIAFTRVFAREEKERPAGEKRIWISACSPGWCRTDMAGDRAPRTAEEGARTPAKLALGQLGAGEEESGKFYYEEKEIAW